MVLGLLLALLSLEVALRLGGSLPMLRNPLKSFHDSDVRLGWRGARNYAGRFVREDFDVTIRHTSEGYRVPGHSVRPFSDARRIAVLGDSFTWGWGVREGQLFTDGLQELLGPRFRVLNYGTNAYGTGQQLILMEELVRRHDFDEVVVMFYENDLRDNLDPKDGRRPWFRADGDRLVAMNTAISPPSRAWLRSVQRSSRSLSWIRFQLNKSGERLRAWSSGTKPTRSRKRSPEPRSWAVQELLLRRMKELCRARGTELLLARIPTSDAFDTPQTAAPDPLADIARSLGLSYLDLTHSLRLHGGQALYFAQDGHWNAEGHRVAAEALARNLGD